MVKHIPIFNIFISTVLYCVLQILYEAAYVEIMRDKLIIEVLILKQDNEGKFWFIGSCPFLTPVIGINIDSTAEMGDNNNNAGLKFQSDQT